MSIQSEALVEEKSDVGTKVATAGGVLGALAMTSCCILPLVLFSLGATGAWIGQMSALYQYKWYFLTFAAVSIGYGFWKVYGRPISVGADCACKRPVSQRVMEGSLWTATVVVAVATAFPYAAPYFLGF